MKHILICLLIALFLLSGAAAVADFPMPTPPPQMQDAADDLVLYYNPDGGSKYHLDPYCASVSRHYLPLAGSLLYRQLNNALDAILTPCAYCGAPLPPEDTSTSTQPQAIPDSLVLYYEPGIGQKYHLDSRCALVPTHYQPLDGWFFYSDLAGHGFSDLTPCTVCGAPPIPTTAAPLETPIDMPAGPDYLTADFGVTTWRGDSFRTNAAVGHLASAPTGLEVVWSVETGVRPDSGAIPDAGFSWYSQPAIIQWPAEIRQSIGLTEEARNTKALKEVIFASLDGSIYFLNLADGTATREAISIGEPMLGAVTVHPLAYPLLMAGQYVRPSSTTGSGLRWYDLEDNRLLTVFDGKAGEDLTGAFNTSALIDRHTNTAVALSKDGYLYAEPLELQFLAASSQKFTMISDFTTPLWVKLTDDGEQITSAPVMYGSRLWFGTSEGRILCVDTATLQRLWSVQPGGMIGSLAMEQDEAGQLWLYTGTATGGADARSCPMQLLRINADTGETDWAITAGDDLVYFYQGAHAACVVGENKLNGLVCFTLNNIRVDGRRCPGLVLALDKTSGRIVWQRELSGECQSSPVAVYAKDGRGWIVQTDEDGHMSLLDGLTGMEVASLTLEGGRWSSPAVYGDMLVIGSCTFSVTIPTGGRIYGVRLRSLQDEVPDTPEAPISRLEAFLRAWSSNDRTAMLDLCSPAWKVQQPNPELALFMLLQNHTPLAWDITGQTVEDNLHVYTMDVLLDRHNGRAPAQYRFMIRLSLESSAFYIIPDSLTAAIPAP